MGRSPEERFSKEVFRPGSPQAREKMPSATHHQGHAGTCGDPTSHQSDWCRQKGTSCGLSEAVERRGKTGTVGRSVTWGSLRGRRCGGAADNESGAADGSGIPASVLPQSGTRALCSFPRAKRGSRLSVRWPGTQEGNTHTGALLSPKDQEPPAIWGPTIKPGGHCAV